MRINEGNKVGSFAQLPHEDGEQTEAPADNSEPEEEPAEE